MLNISRLTIHKENKSQEKNCDNKDRKKTQEICDNIKTNNNCKERIISTNEEKLHPGSALATAEVPNNVEDKILDFPNFKPHDLSNDNIISSNEEDLMTNLIIPDDLSLFIEPNDKTEIDENMKSLEYPEFLSEVRKEKEYIIDSLEFSSDEMSNFDFVETVTTDEVENTNDIFDSDALLKDQCIYLEMEVKS